MQTQSFVDETANVINPPLIEILNKGMEAGFQCVCAMQTISDLEALRFCGTGTHGAWQFE